MYKRQVIDTTDLKEKKQGLKESFIQSIDQNKSNNLEKTVFKKINTLRALKDNNFEVDLNEINLTNPEKAWIINVTDNEWKEWKEEIKNVSQKMLSQGIINTLALEQLNEASSLQLTDLGEKDSPNRSLGAKILSSSFHQKSNLKVDKLKTNISVSYTHLTLPTICSV